MELCGYHFSTTERKEVFLMECLIGENAPEYCYPNQRIIRSVKI